jgi:hypothetical protein
LGLQRKRRLAKGAFFFAENRKRSSNDENAPFFFLGFWHTFDLRIGGKGIGSFPFAVAVYEAGAPAMLANAWIQAASIIKQGADQIEA